MDRGRSGGVGKDRNPLRAWKRGVRWVRDVGMGSQARALKTAGASKPKPTISCIMILVGSTISIAAARMLENIRRQNAVASSLPSGHPKRRE